ncbi:DNA recombination protein RmuC, partial [Pseudoxanthomonas sp. SGD-10]
MEILFISLLILFLAVFLFLKRPKINSDTDLVSQLQTENEQLKIALAVAEQNLKNAQSEASRINDLIKEEKQDNEFKLLGRINRLEEEKQDLLDSLNIEKQKNSTITANLLSEKEKLEEQKQHIDSLQQKFKVEFENIANQILKQKTSEFTEVNKANLDILLNPLKENIKAFEQKIEQSYKTESAERFTLKGAIDELVKQTKLIQDDANNLTKALKGDNKKQGNWGEMVLDRL